MYPKRTVFFGDNGIPHNLTNKFQLLDIFVHKPDKAFISSKYNS